MKQVDLTSQETDAWDRTRTALAWHCPGFVHIFYEMMTHKGLKHIALFTEEVPIAATDGSALMLNPKTFFKYTLPERIFICVHEIMHGILNHMVMLHRYIDSGKVNYVDGTSLVFDADLMNVATDLVINDILITSKVGQFNSEWLHDVNIATAADSALDVYRKLYKEDDGSGRGNPKKPCNGGKGRGQAFDQHHAPGTAKGQDAHDAANSRNDAKWRATVEAGAAIQRAQGKMPAGLERFFGEVLNPQVDWKDKIAALFSRKLGSGGYDWRKPDRRYIVRDIYTPARSGFGAGDVVVAADTSGSIQNAELDMFFAEISGILEDVKPKRLFIMWCDAHVHRVDECGDASDLLSVRAKKPPGGGGTSFEPVFDKIAELGISPDCLVYLTDGYGTFPPHAPRYPVIWGSITKDYKYPFGDVVDVPKQARK